jgi:carboxyl-terminal processing protease
MSAVLFATVGNFFQKFGKMTRAVFAMAGVLLCLYPASTDRLGSIWVPVFGLQRDFSSGHAVVPLEEIFPGLSTDPELDVIRHALRIIEQHYVQRERLDSARMLSGGIRALAREHGGDVELGFLNVRSQSDGLQLSGHRTVQLCPSMSRQSAEICVESGIISVHALPRDVTELQAVVRVGLRVFGVPLLVEPGFKSLDLVGRFVVPEYARLRRVSLSQAVHTFLNGLLDELDPHSSYMTHEEYRELRSGTRGQFGGVGLVIDESQELPLIREVVPNSPAHMAGIRAGDVLLKVGNNISAFRSLESVLRDIRELVVDRAVPVWFFRPQSRRVFRSFLAREEIPTRSTELRVIEGHPEILHIRVTGFSNHTAEDVYSLYEQGQQISRGKIKWMLLDLRGNPGGLLDQAIQLSDLFLRQGKIVSTRSRFEEQVEQTSRSLKIDLPLVVMVNSSSASASEIVAGALKDHGRALIVGERTFGKGSVQSLFELSGGTALKLTVAHYFTPSGRSLQGVGVEPHFEVKLVQPRDDHLWMSGSSEIDREEHLASHLMNPAHSGTRRTPAFNVWALSKPEGQISDQLSPLNFNYPLGDNIQSIVRLDDDPIARVAVQAGRLLFAGVSSLSAFNETHVRDAYRKVVVEEAQRLKAALERVALVQGAERRSLIKSFFDLSVDGKETSRSIGAQKIPSSISLKGDATIPQSAAGSANGPLSGIMNFFGLWGRQKNQTSDGGLGLPRISLAANSLMAWQGASQILVSLSLQELQRNKKGWGPQSAFLGLALDDSHDGPVVWLPTQFLRASDRQLNAAVRVPSAVRAYLSTLASASDKPSVIGQVKLRLGDEPIVLGSLQLPPLAKRQGRLTGTLSQREGRVFLQLHFSPLPIADEWSDVSLSHRQDVAVARGHHAGVEVIVVALSDDRVEVVSKTVRLKWVADGELSGETELKMSPVVNHGIDFGGVVGGIVRSEEGDILATAPLLWANDQGLFAVEGNAAPSSIFGKTE